MIHKNMKKKLIIHLIAILLILVNLIGCLENENNQNKTDEEKLIGIWTNTSSFNGNIITITYTFLSNNTYIVSLKTSQNTSTYSGTWEIINKSLIVTIEGKTNTGDYEFSNNDKTITITDPSSGNITILTKKS